MNKAIVAKIERVAPIPGADKIQVGFVLGQSVVISKDWEVGMVGIFFQPDLQLSDEFCRCNNLYRHSEQNINQSQKGFFDDNRRVRCQPFLKVKSEGFFTTLESLAWCGENAYLDLQVGDQFDQLNGWEVCKKYISEKTRRAMQNTQKKKTKVVEAFMFHKHVDTDQYAYMKHKIQKGDLVSIQSKKHGTSGRYSLSKVRRKPETLKQKFLNFLGLFQAENWEFLVGTRNVTLYEDQYNKEGFHGSEQWRFDILDQLKPYLTKGLTLYVEIVGWANGKPIMATHSTRDIKDKRFTKKYGANFVYKYGCVEGTNDFHIYRITQTDEDGNSIDYTESQLQKWCADRGLKGTLNVCHPFIFDGDFDKLDQLVYDLTEREDMLTEDYTDPSHLSEGIIIRVDSDSTTPMFLKNKSYAFKICEGIAHEKEIDLEAAS